MSYEASLFRERDLRTVTANTRDDGRRLLDVAASLRLTPTVTTVPFEQLDQAIDDIRAGRARGSLLLEVDDQGGPT
jgi:propanol-preferring alcohol dehydrogenase